MRELFKSIRLLLAIPVVVLAMTIIIVGFLVLFAGLYIESLSVRKADEEFDRIIQKTAAR